MSDIIERLRDLGIRSANQAADYIEAQASLLNMLREALKRAEHFIDAMLGFTEQNLVVFNWHLNGEGEPLDTFINDNGGAEALKHAREALATLKSQEK
jgi:hypothetical protein